jgi:hypothetical protein
MARNEDFWNLDNIFNGIDIALLTPHSKNKVVREQRPEITPTEFNNILYEMIPYFYYLRAWGTSEEDIKGYCEELAAWKKYLQNTKILKRKRGQKKRIDN